MAGYLAWPPKASQCFFSMGKKYFIAEQCNSALGPGVITCKIENVKMGRGVSLFPFPVIYFFENLLKLLIRLLPKILNQ